MRRTLWGLALSALLVATVATPADAAPAGAAEAKTITGTIDGADFRVELPDSWNGTLVLYSHGYFPEGFPHFGIGLTNRPADSESEAWLLANGYALAGSYYSGNGTGYAVERALRDQIALLDWFEDNVGAPRHTVSYGQSMGATIGVLLAERNPHRFDGVATICGEYDPQGTFNATLDLTFATKVLLAPDADIDLVHPRDPVASMGALGEAIDRALTTPAGRAKLALVAAFNNVPGWYSAYDPRPTTGSLGWLTQQALWLKNAYAFLGTLGRADLERWAGGNPSSNVGVDYRRQLARSGQDELVRRAYRAAGLDLGADLARLNAAPRVAADPAAVRYMYRYGVPRGTTTAPVISVHTTGDGGAVADQERWYADQVRRAGDPQLLRQVYIERGGHCSINAAEELVVLRTLFARIDTGRWPHTSPPRLTAAAEAFGPGYDLVFDFGTGDDKPMAPAFTRFAPPVFLRPSR
ncbi:DUF6351 family protein [Actinomycetes bacterium KLBMP 9797]